MIIMICRLPARPGPWLDAQEVTSIVQQLDCTCPSLDSIVNHAVTAQALSQKGMVDYAVPM